MSLKLCCHEKKLCICFFFSFAEVQIELCLSGNCLKSTICSIYILDNYQVTIKYKPKYSQCIILSCGKIRVAVLKDEIKNKRFILSKLNLRSHSLRPSVQLTWVSSPACISWTILAGYNILLVKLAAISIGLINTTKTIRLINTVLRKPMATLYISWLNWYDWSLC
jgi:hypothetical protein